MITRADVDPERKLTDAEAVEAALRTQGRVNSLELRLGGFSGNPSERIRELQRRGVPVEPRGNVEVNGRRARLYVWTGTGIGAGRASPTALPVGDPASASKGAPAGRADSDPGVLPPAPEASGGLLSLATASGALFDTTDFDPVEPTHSAWTEPELEDAA